MTFVEHNGTMHEILTGWDEGRTYKVGEKINWWPLMERPGVGIDGVYVEIKAEGFGWGTRTALVVISDGTVVEVEYAENHNDELYFIDPVASCHLLLEQKWPKSLPARDLWPDEIWEARAAATERIKKQAMFRRAE